MNNCPRVKWMAQSDLRLSREMKKSTVEKIKGNAGTVVNRYRASLKILIKLLRGKQRDHLLKWKEIPRTLNFKSGIHFHTHTY